MSFRKVLFWMHLIVGTVAGLVILVMSATGVLLTYQRQILAYVERGPYQVAKPGPGAKRLDVDELAARLTLPRNASLVMRADPGEPVEVTAGRGEGFYVSPWDGRVLGSADVHLRQNFQKIVVWHRWLGTEGEGRATGKAITGGCNLAFLFIVVSGLYLWLPKFWTARHLRPIVWFRGGLSGKARDFNWHNVFGIWMAVPLVIVVASGLPMSYAWANNLLYTMTGSELPAQGGRGGEGRGPGKKAPAPVATNLAPLMARVQAQNPDWQSISVRIPQRVSEDVTLIVDLGDGGQPQKRSTLTFDPVTFAVRKSETFAGTSPGRQLRSWSRFAHTGEYYGLVGQTIAGMASLAGVMLVWTGIALALRRFSGWRARS